MGLLNFGRQLEFKLEVFRSDDTTSIDLTNFWTSFSMDYGNVRNITGASAADGLSRTATITIQSDFNNRFSPLDFNSSYNIVGSEIQELFFSGRKIKASFKIDDGQFKNVFTGRLGDDIIIKDGEIRLTCRDESKFLQDRQIIETEIRSYTATPIAYETYMQNTLDDVFGVGAYTLEVPVASGLTVVPQLSDYQYKTVWRFLQSLALQMGGWFVGYWENATETDFTLQLFEPDRTKTVSDLTIDSQSDLTIGTEVNTTDIEIKNYIIVQYYDAVSAPQQEIVFDQDSIDKYGLRKILTLDRDKLTTITTSAAAINLGNSALSDLTDQRKTVKAVMRYTNQIRPFTLISIDYPKISSEIIDFSPDSIRANWDFNSSNFSLTFSGSERVTGQKNSWFELSKVNR